MSAYGSVLLITGKWKPASSFSRTEGGSSVVAKQGATWLGPLPRSPAVGHLYQRPLARSQAKILISSLNQKSINPTGLVTNFGEPGGAGDLLSMSVSSSRCGRARLRIECRFDRSARVRQGQAERPRVLCGVRGEEEAGRHGCPRIEVAVPGAVGGQVDDIGIRLEDASVSWPAVPRSRIASPIGRAIEGGW